MNKTREGLRVVVGGGSGFIGSALTRHLRGQGHSVCLISRHKEVDSVTWDEIEKDGLPPCDAVINLAGANLMGQLLWTDAYRREVWRSRIETNRTIARAVTKMPSDSRPGVFVSASAVGYYPTGIPGPTVDEDTTPAADSWCGQLCQAWEAAADEVPTARVVKLRTGVVLGEGGGALGSMKPAFGWGLGNVLGDGRQWVPWVHREDVVGIYEHAVMKEDVVGVLNGVAPDAKNAQEFGECLAKVMKTSVKFHVPRALVTAGFGADRATLLCEGQKVEPKRTLESGYVFKHTNLEEALADVCRS